MAIPEVQSVSLRHDTRFRNERLMASVGNIKIVKCFHGVSLLWKIKNASYQSEGVLDALRNEYAFC